jgi:hypothetical protein
VDERLSLSDRSLLMEAALLPAFDSTDWRGREYIKVDNPVVRIVRAVCDRNQDVCSLYWKFDLPKVDIYDMIYRERVYERGVW